MCFVIDVFFKHAKIKNRHYLNVKGPVIIAMNHPNAFMDPIAFTTLVYPPRVLYLARGDAFKPGIVSRLLESLGIIPIFRIQDGGREGLKKNDETYDRVNLLLKRNQKIIIFAEGLCIQERRLRPLKKGVPRMVFGAMDEYNLENLTVVPVGINYTNPSQFRGTIFCNIGAPMKVSDYMDAYRVAPAKTMNQFLADLAPRMKELIVHIDHKHTEAVIAHVEEVYRYDYYQQENLSFRDPEHAFLFSTKVVEVINRAEKDQPEKVAALAEKTSAYIGMLKKYGLRDWLVNPAKQGSVTYGAWLLRMVVLALSFPIYLRGLAGSYVPYWLTGLITQKKVRVIEFKASFNMGIGAMLFLLWTLFQFFIAKALAPNYWWALLVLAVTIFTSWICLHLSPFRKKTRGIYRALQLKKHQADVWNRLQAQRSEIISDFRELL